MTHYQEIRRENAERRLALGGFGLTLSDTMTPFCGASRYEGQNDDEVDMTPGVDKVDCPGCKALLLLRRLVWQLTGANGLTIETSDASQVFAEVRELLVSLGDAS